MLEINDLLEKFRKNNKNRILGRSKLWEYKDEIKVLLEDGFSIAAIYEYLRDYRQIKYKLDYFYVFMRRNKDKILNTQTSIEQTTTQPEPVKEEEPKQQPKPSTPQPKPDPKPQIKEPEQEAETTTPKPQQEQKQYKDRTEEYKRYKELYKISKVTSEYEEMLSKNEFEKAMNILQEVQNLDFASIENGISGKYDDRETAKLIISYIGFVFQKLKKNEPSEKFKGITPKFWLDLMGSGNVFQNFIGSD